MVIWNELEDLRRRENRRRGYVEVKTPLIYDRSRLGDERPLGEVPGEHVHGRRRGRGAAREPEADELPGHMLLFGSQLRSYRDLPIRYAESSTLHRNELAGTLHGLLRVRHVTQDDAHIFCTEEQVADEIDGCIEFARTCTRSSG